MALLQPRLSLKVSQRQVLTPGLMQMVSVLALNKLELKEMIDAEMVENPVLEEIDERFRCWMKWQAARNAMSARSGWDCSKRERKSPRRLPKDSFNEVDFGSYFQEYLDPGFGTQPEYEDSEKPSFENFLSSAHDAFRSPGVATGRSEPDSRSADHAAELVIGNLDDDGYLAASEEELAEAYCQTAAGLRSRMSTALQPRLPWSSAKRPTTSPAAPSIWCSISIPPALAPAISRMPHAPG